MHDGLLGAELIKELYDDDKFAIIIVEGKNGSGKTTYACNLLNEVYKTFKKVRITKDLDVPRRLISISEPKFYYDWDISFYKHRMGYHPKKVIEAWKKQKERDYMYIWDDAGSWLCNLDYANAFVKSIGKYLQVARTKFACIVFTCIDKADVTSKIRNFKSSYIADVVYTGDHTSPYPSQKYRAEATCWHYWSDRLEKKIGTEDDFTDSFIPRMPPQFYNWYLPIRKYYVTLQEKYMMDALRNQKDIMKYRRVEF